MGVNQIREAAAQNEQKKTDAESARKQTRKQGNIYNKSLMSLFLAYRSHFVGCVQCVVVLSTYDIIIFFQLCAVNFFHISYAIAIKT